MNKQTILKNLIGKNIDSITKIIKEKHLSVADVFQFASDLSTKDAYPFLQAILSFEIPNIDETVERMLYLRVINNAIIYALVQGYVKEAAKIAEDFKNYVEENIYIAHSAACAFGRAGNKEQALEMVKIAMNNDYEHIDKLEIEKDLDLLREDDRFKALFSFPQIRKEDDDTVIIEMINNQKVTFRICDYDKAISKRELATIEYIKNNFDTVMKKAYKGILDYYKAHYEDYKAGMESELDEYADILPKATKNLKIEQYLSDLEIYLPSKKKYNEGDFGLAFECTWDEEHGIGVAFRNFKLKDAGMQEEAFF